MEVFLLSTGLVALAEIGDKTQLLALILATRFRKPVPIVGGILLATLLNHAAAGALGAWIADALSPKVLQWVLGASFIAMAAWMLVPDKFDAPEHSTPRYGVLLTTAIAFFLLEIGDKTQIATLALAAQHDALGTVVAGTTLGMLVANVPVILLGGAASQRLNVRLVQRIAAGVFAALGVLVLIGA